MHYLPAIQSESEYLMVFKKALARQLTTNRHLYIGRKREIKNIFLDVRGALGNKQGVTNTIKTEFEGFFRGKINDFGRQLVPRFDNADRKCKLAACQMGQLRAKFEAMATKIWICWRLEEVINGEFHLLMEYVIHQDQVRAQSQMDQ